MKRFFLCLTITALSTSMLMAEGLTSEQAWNRVITVFGNTPLQRRSVTNVSPELLKTVNMSDNTPAYYVFATGERTIFASADDVAAPVLGYTNNAVDDITSLPPALSYMLDTYVKEIEWAKANGITVTYARAYDSDMSSIEPLIVTTWDQGTPYNNFCPPKDGEETYTGCVATAVAQVMYYHRYPTVGQGTVSYEWYGQTLEQDLSDHYIDWDNMLLSYNEDEGWTDEQATAIATFMIDCGYALKMDYGTSEEGGSGTTTNNAASMLVSNYCYDKGLRLETRIFYSDEQWEQMIYEELAESRPVVYTGCNQKGGHAFVCDGYQSDGYFHINWGWGGYCDGYFLLSALSPSGSGAGGGAGGYNSAQDAMIGIQQPQEGSQEQVPYIGAQTSIYALSDGYELEIVPDEDEYGNAGFFANLGYDEATFTIGVKLVSVTDDKDTLLVDEDKVDLVYLPLKRDYYISVTIPSDTPLGEYLAYPVYKCTYNGEDADWTNVWLPYGTAEYISLEVTETGVTVADESMREGINILDLDVPSTIAIDEMFSIDITLYNNLDEMSMYYFEVGLYDNEEDHNLLGGYVTMGGTIERKAEKTVSLECWVEDIAPVDEDLEVPGDYVIGVTIMAYKYLFQVQIIDETATGIDSVDADLASEESRVYDLSGREVTSHKPKAGIYILKSDSETRKVIIK